MERKTKISFKYKEQGWNAASVLNLAEKGKLEERHAACKWPGTPQELLAEAKKAQEAHTAKQKDAKAKAPKEEPEVKKEKPGK